MKRITRRHRSQDEIDKILADYRRSGLSQSAFSEDRGLALSTLSNWLRGERSGLRKRRAKKGGTHSQLVPVRVVNAPGVSSNGMLELESARGYLLRFPVGLDPDILARYVEALATRC